MGFWQRMERFFFGRRKEFDRIVLSGAAVTQIMGFARQSHPKEFSALLEGKIEGGVLTLKHVIYQQFEASDRAAVIHINVPITTDIEGSVHSHPTPNNSPSAADKRYFNKYGYVNFIIGFPYRPQDIACYDPYGKPLLFEIL